MHVLAFTGLPGSGKSESIAVARELGIPVLRMGDFVLEEVRRQGLAQKEEHIGPVATRMRETEGEDVWARRTLEAIRSEYADGSSQTPLVVVDGVRSPAEADCFRRELGGSFVLVAIEASERARHERILGRGRVDDAKELELVVRRDRREKGWGLERAIDQADHRIVNEGSRDELRARVMDLLKRLQE